MKIKLRNLKGDYMSVDYGVKDIKTLEGIEAIRLRPGMSNFSFLMGIPL
jgi:hypothetical protein